MKKKFRIICILIEFLTIGVSGGFCENLVHKTLDKNAPVVYFTKDISASGLMKVYRALNQKMSGKTGIKISFGGPDEQVLDASLLTELVKTTGGTLIDCNGLSGNRWTSAMNYALAKANGFSAVGKTQMLDENGDIDMPVKNGFYLKYARTGSHFDEYDTLIAVHKFKLHYLPALGGNIKNISICLGSRSGKCIIHSAGKDDRYYRSTSPEVRAKSFADAAKAAVDYKKNWAFINVLDSFNPQDSCVETKNPGNIGIIASVDVVALDQCAVDFEIENTDVSEKTKSDWKKTHQVDVLMYAEQLGLGKRYYRFVNLDD